MACKEENRSLFSLLLQVLPTGTDLWLRQERDANADWEPVTVEELCGEYGLLYIDRRFPDHGESAHPDAVSILRDYGLVDGKDDGCFHPQDPLTRAELCQMLAEALACTVPNNSSPFSDVSDDAWYAPAVIAMSNMGLVNGVGDGTFRPEDPVDHQQFLAIMGRAAQWLNMYFYNTAAGVPQELPLQAENLAGYAEWARCPVWLLANSQSGGTDESATLLWDSTLNISATAPTTRDEAAFTLYSILSYTGILTA